MNIREKMSLEISSNLSLPFRRSNLNLRKRRQVTEPAFSGRVVVEYTNDFSGVVMLVIFFKLWPRASKINLKIIELNIKRD